MNKTFATTSVMYPNFLLHSECQIGEFAIKHFQCLGVQEYSYIESEVDELLGERSYSGGDLTADIFEDLELDAAKKSQPIVNFYFETKQVAQHFGDWLGSLNLNIDFKIDENDVEDWNAYWRKSYDIINLYSDYRIVPSWKKEQNLPRDIYIYPGMGFGTGNHETTYLCLQALFEYQLNCERVLDFGCGSGILGIGAIKAQPDAYVDFYDIDKEALLNCQQNLKLNELSTDKYSKYLCLLPEQRSQIEQAPYSLVFANILKHVLIGEKKSLARYTRNQGHLVLSGILNEQVEEVLSEFLSEGFTHIKTYQKNDWTAILLQK